MVELNSNRNLLALTSRIVLLLVAIGCELGDNLSPNEQKASADAEPTPRPEVQKIENPTLHNLLAINQRMYSGSEPVGDNAFRELAALGIKVIVSVDGARPNVELAKKHGMRYVHIPTGYDGVPPKAGAALARVVREIDGPIYFHCHHGQHRGPAATAIACIAAGIADVESATDILEVAGTGKNYAGLWRDVKNYCPPALDEELPKLLEIADVDSLASVMAKLDRSFDNLKLARDGAWAMPKDRPDISPPHEALLVREYLQEASREIHPGQDDRYKRWIVDAVATAEALEASLNDGNKGTADRQIKALDTQCKECHARYRN